MPFVKPEIRASVDKDVRLTEAPGDLCYYFYKNLVTEWKDNPRWTTAHELYKDYIVNTDHFIELQGTKYTQRDMITALHLAWQVFFIKYVMPYEDIKEKENGTI